MLKSPLVRFVCVSLAMALSLYLAYLAIENSVFSSEGPILVLWFFLAALWTVGFAYLCVKYWVANIWLLALCVKGFGKLGSVFSQAHLYVVGFTSLRKRRND